MPPYRAGDSLNGRFYGGCIVTNGGSDVLLTVPLDRPVAPGARPRCGRLAMRVRQGGRYLLGTADAVEQAGEGELSSFYLSGFGINFRFHREGGIDGAANNDVACVEAELEVEFY